MRWWSWGESNSRDELPDEWGRDGSFGRSVTTISTTLLCRQARDAVAERGSRPPAVMVVAQAQVRPASQADDSCAPGTSRAPCGRSGTMC